MAGVVNSSISCCCHKESLEIESIERVERVTTTRLSLWIYTREVVEEVRKTVRKPVEHIEHYRKETDLGLYQSERVGVLCNPKRSWMRKILDVAKNILGLVKIISGNHTT